MGEEEEETLLLVVTPLPAEIKSIFMFSAQKKSQFKFLFLSISFWPFRHRTDLSIRMISLFKCAVASLYEVVSVGLSVRRSVGPSRFIFEGEKYAY